MFEPYLSRWDLQADGEPILTPSSRLLPVRSQGRPAMLKIASDCEERFGALVMRWWDGRGAARVYAHHGEAVLMERALGGRSLRHMALHGQDDEASRIACATVAELHAPRTAPNPANLLPLSEWFAALAPVAHREGGIFRESLAAAEELLASPQEVVVLHGDIHHDNVLDFEERGWLAIDPKRLVGERGFDYANLLCNPELATVTRPERFRRQSRIIAQAAGLDDRRLLQWALAYAGLSAAWFREDGDNLNADSDLRVAGLALQALSHW